VEEDQDKTAPIFTEEERRNFAAYFNTLKRIHIRLLIERYRIVDGEIVHPRQHDETESKS
jgi:hypothetical protein